MTSKSCSSETGGKNKPGIRFGAAPFPSGRRAGLWRLVGGELRRALWLPVLTALGFFFALPVYLLLTLQPLLSRVRDGSEVTVDMFARRLANVFTQNNYSAAALLCVAAVVSAAFLFSYLHSRRQLDFFHGLPIRREKLFLAKFLAGLISFWGPYLLMLGIAVLLAVCLGKGALLPGAQLLGTLGVYLLLSLCSYTIAVLINQLCGTVVVSLLLSVIALVWAPSVLGLVKSYLDMFLLTFNATLSLPTDTVVLFSPAVRIFTLAGSAFSLWETLGYLGCAALLFFAALLLNRRRPSEGAGHALAFPKAHPFFKFPIVFLCTLALGLVFHTVESGPYADGGANPFAGCGWLIFGMVCGAVISHAVLEIVYASDFKRIFHHIGWLGVYAAAVALLLCSTAFDWFRYDSYIPQPSSIRSAQCLFAGLDYYAGGSYYSRLTDDEALERNTYGTAAEIGAVLRLAQAGVEWNVLTPAERTEQGQDRGVITVTVIWKLRGGGTAARDYSVPVAAQSDSFAVLYDSDVYKQSSYALLSSDPDDIAFTPRLRDGFSQLNTGSDNLLAEIPADKVQRQLFEALQKDLLAQTWQAYNEADVLYLCDIELFYDGQPADYPYWYDDYSRSYQYTYPVYATYQNTLSLLRSLGIEPGLPAADGLRAVVTRNSPEEMEKYGMDGVAAAETVDGSFGQSSFTFSRPADVARLLPGLIPQEFIDYRGPLAPAMGSVEVELSGLLGTGWYRYPADAVPDVVQAVLK